MRLPPSACCLALGPEGSGRALGDPECGQAAGLHLSSPFPLNCTHYVTQVRASVELRSEKPEASLKSDNQNVA